MYDCITAALKKKRQRVLAINGTPDHMHVLVGMTPEISIDNIQATIRSVSTAFVNDSKLTISPFNWQEGYCAFSFHYTEIDEMVKYINEQKILHLKTPFKKEFIAILRAQNLDYDEENSFDFLDQQNHLAFILIKVMR